LSRSSSACSLTPSTSATRIRRASTSPSSTGIVITGRVFHDSNGDGVRGPKEKALQRAQVYIDTDNDGAWDDGEPLVRTNGAGRYGFSDQPAGTHRVRLLGTPHEYFTSGGFSGQTSFSTLNGLNDYGPWEAFYQTAPAGFRKFTAVPGDIVTSRNFALQTPVALTGTVFRDTSGDGMLQGALEKGLRGWTVYLDEDRDGVGDPGERQATTDDHGFFWIELVRPGVEHQIVVGSKRGFSFTGVNGAVATASAAFSGGRTDNLNVGVASALVSGRMFIDANGNGLLDTGEAGLAKPLELHGGPAGSLPRGIATDANGAFAINDLPAGHYTLYAPTDGFSPWIEPRLGGLTTTHWGGDRFDFDLATGQVLRHDFAMRLDGGAIQGVLFIDSNGNGRRDKGEPGAHDKVTNLYIDLDNDGHYDDGEPYAYRGSSAFPLNGGEFYLRKRVPPGPYVLRVELVYGWEIAGGSVITATLNPFEVDKHDLIVRPAT